MQRYFVLILIACLGFGCKRGSPDIDHHASSAGPKFKPAGLVSVGNQVLVSGSIRKDLSSETVVGIYGSNAEFERLVELDGRVPRAMHRSGDYVAVGTIDYTEKGSPVSYVHTSSDMGKTWHKTELSGLDLIGLNFKPDAKGFAWSASRIVVVDNGHWGEVGTADVEYQLTKFLLYCSDQDAVLIAGSRKNAYEHWIVALKASHFERLVRLDGNITGVVALDKGSVIISVERKGVPGFELLIWDLQNPDETRIVGRSANGHVESLALKNGSLFIAGNDGAPTNPWTTTLWQGTLPKKGNLLELKPTKLNVGKYSTIGFAEDASLWCFSPDEGIIKITTSRTNLSNAGNP